MSTSSYLFLDVRWGKGLYSLWTWIASELVVLLYLIVFYCNLRKHPGRRYDVNSVVFPFCFVLFSKCWWQKQKRFLFLFSLFFICNVVKSLLGFFSLHSQVLAQITELALGIFFVKLGQPKQKYKYCHLLVVVFSKKVFDTYFISSSYDWYILTLFV